VKKCPLCVVVVPDLAAKCPQCHGSLLVVKPTGAARQAFSPWLLLSAGGLLILAWVFWRTATRA
jgi:hypothetical protein